MQYSCFLKENTRDCDKGGVNDIKAGWKELGSAHLKHLKNSLIITTIPANKISEGSKSDGFYQQKRKDE